MAEVFPRFCPRCGATTLASQRFCARCGLDMATRIPQRDAETARQDDSYPFSPMSHSLLRTQHSSPIVPKKGTLSSKLHFGRPQSLGRWGIVLLLLMLFIVLGTVTYI